MFLGGLKAAAGFGGNVKNNPTSVDAIKTRINDFLIPEVILTFCPL
jgi:hypothetical protein